MSIRDIKKELIEMRAQLEAMSQRVAQDSPPEPTPLNDEAQGRGHLLDKARTLAQDAGVPEIADQLAQFLKTLEKDVRTSKTNALVAAFISGVIVGKLISK